MEINNEKKFDFFIDTLKFLTTDVKNASEIKNALEELEGDYYSFLSPLTINFLLKKKYISKDTSTFSKIIYYRLFSLSPKKWNIDSYINDNDWLSIRDLAKKTINRLDSKE